MATGRRERFLGQRTRDRETLRVGRGVQEVVGRLGMSVPIPSIGGVELTAVQQRALEGLIGSGERPVFPADLSQRLRDRIEQAARALELRGPLELYKGHVSDQDRCEGLLDARLKHEVGFEHSPRSATGTLVHKAIELDVLSREEPDPHALIERAVSRLESIDAFAGYWGRLDPLGRDELLMAGAKGLETFRSTFPPIRRMRAELTPMTEWWLKARLLGGALVLGGCVDLALGRHDPPRAGRLLIDLKTGSGASEYAEELRFYALIHTLQFDVPPYRLASLFVDSGEWQPEDVTEEVLFHAADRVIATVRAIVSLKGGSGPQLRPGFYCGWCPRSSVCPVSAARGAWEIEA